MEMTAVQQPRATFERPFYGVAAGLKVVRGASKTGERHLHLDPPRTAGILASMNCARGCAWWKTENGFRKKKKHRGSIIRPPSLWRTAWPQCGTALRDIQNSNGRTKIGVQTRGRGVERHRL